MRPEEQPMISLTAACAADVRAKRLEKFAPIEKEINHRTVILQGSAPRMSGDMGSIFMTYDGKWWRVETRLETFEKRKKREPIQEAFIRMASIATLETTS